MSNTFARRPVRHTDRLPPTYAFGLSQGKDSTCCAQIIWDSIAALRPDLRTRQLHPISCDSLMEAPRITERTYRTRRLMEQAARDQQMPIVTYIARPVIAEHILVILIG